MKIFLTSIIITLFFLADIFSQNSSPNYSSINKDYFINYFKDAGKIITSPTRFNTKNWLTATAVVGTTSFLFTQDITVHDFFQKHKTYDLNNVTKYALQPWGNIYSISTIGLFYLQGTFFKNDKSKETSLLGLEAILLSSGIAQIPKITLRRYRPYQLDPADSWRWFGKFNNNSFYSGHTTASFALATIMAYEYSDHKWVPVVAYSIATLTGLSRIYDNKHWSSDVFLGATMGILIGKFIYKTHHKVIISPVGRSGLGLHYNF